MTDTVVLPTADAVTGAQIDPYLDLEAEINRLREEKDAVILAHYYQDPDIQDIADFVGDSLDLSRKAASTDADVIVFCGVRFMAEVAKILNPSKLVLLPDAEAGCSLEDSCPPDEFRAFREKHPDHIAISYINCSADVKALSDIICTSSNAEAIIRSLPEDQPILFAPDQHLGGWLAKKCDREITLWPGSCIVHDQFSERELVKLKTRHADAMVAAHPECPESILKYADHVGSTKGILDFVTNDPHDTFIVATEQHIFHQMEKSAPGKTFIAAPGADGTCSCASCPFMELNTMEKLYLALLNESPRVELPEELRKKAQAPLNRMMELSPPAQAQAAAE
jgi:quinolinate synthase